MLGKDVSNEDYFIKAKEDGVFTTDIRLAKAYTSKEAVKTKS